MSVKISATVIQEDKATIQLGLHSENGITFQTVNNPWLVAQIRKVIGNSLGAPSKITITIDPAP